MKSRPLRASQSQEKRLAKSLGGRVTPRSGAGWKVKGDVRTDEELLEAKWTGARQVTIKAEVLEKISNEAVAELRRPVTAFTVGGLDYVVMPIFYYAELREATRYYTDEADTPTTRPNCEEAVRNGQTVTEGGSG